MRMRSPAISVLILCLLTDPSFGAGKPKTSQRIGDLVITLIGAEKPEREGTPADRYPVAVRFQAENVGKQALCVAFGATLKASFGLEYHDFSFGPDALDVRELLPGESAGGEYDFLVKTGSQPLQLVLKPTRKSQTCAPGKDSASAIWHGADQLTFDLADFSAGALQNQATPSAATPDRSGTRVFITATRGENHQADAVKLFNDRCPLARITTAKGKADYLVQLTPKSFRQNKNVVLVTNQTGDLIYSGAAINLGNAMKDACSAILNDANLKSK